MHYILVVHVSMTISELRKISKIILILPTLIGLSVILINVRALLFVSLCTGNKNSTPSQQQWSHDIMERICIEKLYLNKDLLYFIQHCWGKYICYYAYYENMKENNQTVSIQQHLFSKIIWLIHLIHHKHFADCWQLKAPDFLMEIFKIN